MATTTRTRQPRLGRGLSSLLAKPVPVSPLMEGPGAPGEGSAEGSTREVSASEAKEFTYLSLDAIERNPNQPRQRFDPKSLEQLSASLRAQGLMQPVIVRPSPGDAGGGRYQLVAGERRWLAAREAGLSEIPAIVRALGDRETSEWALVENLQRDDLNPIEQATAFQGLLEQFGLSHDQVAQRVGVERSTISNSLRLLKLCKEVQDLVREGLLSSGHAKALGGVSDPQGQRLLAKRAITQDLSVRRLEQEVRRTQGDAIPGAGEGSEPRGGRTAPRAAHLADLEQQIGRQLGTKVQVRTGRKKGSGSLTIDFYSMDQFENLLASLGVKIE